MAAIFCDTDCELWYTHARELNLEVIRMPYTIDGEEKLCDLGEETDSHDFYTKMRNGASASTAGLNQQIYYDTFEPFFKRGEDILYIAFSSKLSGTFEYLDLAIAELKKQYPNVKFRKFDTLNICMGAGLLVYMAGKYCREHGDDIDATYAYLERNVSKVGIYFVVDDMKYLARGGRISPAKAKIGNLMNIKPVLTVEDGKLTYTTDYINGIVFVDVNPQGLEAWKIYVIVGACVLFALIVVATVVTIAVKKSKLKKIA